MHSNEWLVVELTGSAFFHHSPSWCHIEEKKFRSAIYYCSPLWNLLNVTAKICIYKEQILISDIINGPASTYSSNSHSGESFVDILACLKNKWNEWHISQSHSPYFPTIQKRWQSYLSMHDYSWNFTTHSVALPLHLFLSLISVEMLFSCLFNEIMKYEIEVSTVPIQITHFMSIAQIVGWIGFSIVTHTTESRIR